jgi:hypothetical protein
VGPRFVSRIQAFHEYLEQMTAPFAHEDAVVATALDNGVMAEQPTGDSSQHFHHPDSDGSFAARRSGVLPLLSLALPRFRIGSACPRWRRGASA